MRHELEELTRMKIKFQVSIFSFQLSDFCFPISAFRILFSSFCFLLSAFKFLSFSAFQRFSFFPKVCP